MNDKILYGLLDFSGNIIIPFRYDTVSNTDYRYNINFIAVAKNGRWGVIDKTGNWSGRCATAGMTQKNG